jgi:hypothetical protein
LQTQADAAALIRRLAKHSTRSWAINLKVVGRLARALRLSDINAVTSDDAVLACLEALVAFDPHVRPASQAA